MVTLCPMAFYLESHVVSKLFNEFFKSYPFELSDFLDTAHDLQVCVAKLPIPDVLLAQTLYKGMHVDFVLLL